MIKLLCTHPRNCYNMSIVYIYYICESEEFVIGTLINASCFMLDSLTVYALKYLFLFLRFRTSCRVQKSAIPHQIIQQGS